MAFGACSMIPMEGNTKPFGGVAALMARKRDVMTGKDLRQVDGMVDFDEDISDLTFLLNGFELQRRPMKI